MASDEKAKNSYKTFWIAGGLSLIWLVGAFALGWFAEPGCEHCIGTFSRLTANEWGDFLAGVFAPIAFLWLVVAVWIQSAELKEQRIELQLTREEFGHQREVMEAQADEARKQAIFIGTQTEILQATEQRRVYEERQRFFQQLVIRIHDLMARHRTAFNLTARGLTSPTMQFETQVMFGVEALTGFGERLLLTMTKFRDDHLSTEQFDHADAFGFELLREEIVNANRHMQELDSVGQLQADRYGFDLAIRAFEIYDEVTRVR